MRAVWIEKSGGPGVLKVKETPTPDPKPGEVRIAVKAAGLNFADVMARQGLYPDAPKTPCVVGYEGSGVVEALGDGVEQPAIGTRVLYLSRFWGQADHVCVPAAQALPIPDNMTFEQAAAIPVNYLTAYHMLFEIRRVRPGEHILIHMAAGGVGTAALQLCNTVDNLTTYGTASLKKHDHVRKHGCDHPIDYRSKDYVEEINRITDGRGVDLVLDALGGPDWKKGYGVLKPTGMLIAFGLANANKGGKRNLFHAMMQILRSPRYNPMTLMDTNRAVAGVNVGHLWEEQALLKRLLTKLIELFEQGAIVPHIHGTFPFSKAKDAHAELEYGRNVGKVLLLPD